MYFRAYKPKVSVWHQIIEFQIFLWKDKNKRAMVFFLIVRSNPHRRRTTLYFWWKQRINCNFRLQYSIEEISPKTKISPKLIRSPNWIGLIMKNPQITDKICPLYNWICQLEIKEIGTDCLGLVFAWLLCHSNGDGGQRIRKKISTDFTIKLITFGK